eukprot:TRINITY_DN9241_c0_g2_i1.p1 TRINITY_DN9241_c0_g2~~TRINITY_DN9241_c0_g2_i1.p1  ORF type:complete len:682 (-),score=97.28 TRINITY_DN9241_c0_g2_i1:1709-3754(-)
MTISQRIFISNRLAVRAQINQNGNTIVGPKNGVQQVVMRPLTPSTQSQNFTLSTPQNGSSQNGHLDGNLSNGNSPNPPQIVQTADFIDVVKKESNSNTLTKQPKNQSVAIQKSALGLDGQELILDTDFKWAQESYSPLVRSIDIWSFVILLRAQLFLLNQKWTYPSGFSEEKRNSRAKNLAIFVRESILQLGPTFIKLGQLFSTRSDLFPSEFVDELAKLQDRVPAIAPEKAKEIVERELGKPIEKLFKTFEEYPIAAASLGQVHRGQLFSGELVAIKIQRPGLSELFDIDLYNMKIISEYLDSQDEDSDFVGIYQESSQILYKEIDYINEGRNADKFRRNFRDTPWVKTPKVFWAYTSPKVLTLEYLPGTKISEKDYFVSQGLDTQLLAQRATDAYLMQVTRHGFFHADPHPGNVSVDQYGNLLFYDFGMMGEIKSGTRQNILEVCFGIYSKDVDRIIDALIRMEVVKPTGDKLSLKRTLTFFVNNIQRQTEQEETLSKIGEDIFAIGTEKTFRFPATFTFVLRSFSTLEGVGKVLDSEYKFSRVAQPYANELLEIENQQEFLLQTIQQQAGEIGQAAAQVPLRVERMEKILSQIELGELKVRAKVLESERFDYRATVVQSATLNAIASLAFLNLGSTFVLMDKIIQGEVTLAISAAFAVYFLINMKRVKRLQEFEQKIR